MGMTGLRDTLEAGDALNKQVRFIQCDKFNIDLMLFQIMILMRFSDN